MLDVLCFRGRHKGRSGYGSFSVFFFQAEDGIRDLVRSRGLGDVYKRQMGAPFVFATISSPENLRNLEKYKKINAQLADPRTCLLYTSDAADERSSVDLGGRRIIKKKNKK